MLMETAVPNPGFDTAVFANSFKDLHFYYILIYKVYVYSSNYTTRNFLKDKILPNVPINIPDSINCHSIVVYT